ncbi:hypothetical protein TRFO_25058 [Tritrichomonas foetus]|uniref:Uncharacterized protein n=1 Tax=Tritrichomonas foetus TaxID=1144522 RepID=A0A1J4K795_9EUKA|nr:hypothetical protein TRFO_25058 [Tritrichomonas foetus]|eukprot:OHT06874.1 hypothetical protein TRFO_25058 [Tritrichomonas foetus]
MDYPLALKESVKLDNYLRLNDYDNAAKFIAKLTQNLSPSFCISSNPGYKNDTVNESLFTSIIKLTDHSDTRLKTAANSFIKHWSYVVSSIAPLDYIKSIHILVNDSAYSKYLSVLMPAFDNAISTFGDEDRQNNFTLISQTTSKLGKISWNLVPEAAWATISKFAPTEGIIKRFEANKDLSFAPCTAKLIASKPSVYAQYLFTPFSLEFLARLFENMMPGTSFSGIDILTNRMGTVINDPNSPEFGSCCDLLDKLIIFNHSNFTESQINTIKNMVSSVVNILKSGVPFSEEITTIIHKLLITATQYQYSERSILKEIAAEVAEQGRLPVESPKRILYFDMLINSIEKGDNFTEFHYYTKTFNMNDNLDHYIYVIQQIVNNLDILRENDPVFISHFTWELTHPLPLDKKLAIVILKYLNSLEISDIVDRRAELQPEQIIYTYIEFEDQEIYKEIAKFIKKLNIEIDISKVDMFKSSFSLFIDKIDYSIFHEMVEYRMFHPRCLSNAFKIMRQNPSEFSDYYSLAFYALELISLELGFNLSLMYRKEKLQPFEPNERFVTIDDIHSLFIEVNGSMLKSQFGKLVREVVLTTESYLSSLDLTQNTDVVMKTIIICSNLSIFDPTSILPLLHKTRLIHDELNRPEAMSKLFYSAADLIVSAKIPTLYSVPLMNFLISFQPPDWIIQQFPDHALVAASVDRRITDYLKNDLHQPLSVMPTFLSFVGIPEHKEYVNTCTVKIPPNMWIIQNDDDVKIKSLPLGNKMSQVLNQIQNKLTLINSQNNDESDTATNMELSTYTTNRAERFEYQQPKITPAEKIHETEPGTLYNITSFLYHSNSPLPESISPEYLNKLAMSNAKNVKLLCGFFLWAYQNKYTLDIKEWSTKINIRKYNDSWYLAVALFLLNVKGNINTNRRLFIDIVQKCLISFGYPSFTKETLVKAYEKETGVKWFLVRNVILVDPEFFNEYPLIISELTKNRKLFKKFFDTQSDVPSNSLLSSFISVCNVLVKPDDNDMINTEFYPSNYYYTFRMLNFNDRPSYLKPRKVPKDLVDSIISFLKRQTNVPIYFYSFFAALSLTEDQEKAVNSLFFTENTYLSHRKFMLPATYLLERPNDRKIEDFFSYRTPSFSRAYFRSLGLSLVKSVDREKIKKATECLGEVFPALCYGSHAQYGMKMGPNASAFSKVYFGVVDSSMSKELIENMKLPSQESLLAFRVMCTLPDDVISIVLPYAMQDILREEFARLFLNTIAGESSNIQFAAHAARMVIRIIGLPSALAIVGNKEFINNPNFACTTIVFHILEKEMKVQNNQEGINYLKMLRAETDSLFDDPSKGSAFADTGKNESIDFIIHHNI